MWIGAVFLDYDGTLADQAQGVPVPSTATKAAIDRLRINGYLPVLCTGRPVCYLTEGTRGLAFGGRITTNGAYAELDGCAIFNRQIEEPVARRLTELCEQLGVSYSLEGQHACYYRSFGGALEGFLDRFGIPTDNFYPLDRMNGWNVNKLVIAYDREAQFQELEQACGGDFVFDRHTLFTSSDVTRKGVNKGTGLRQFLEQTGIPVENTYAIGDSDNDLGMMREAGTGIAMGRHSERMGPAAAYITDSIENEGVAKALAHFGLI